jgi:hypothetical protein
MDSGLYLPHVAPLQATPPSLEGEVAFLRSAVLEPHPDTNTRIVALSEKDLALLLAALRHVEWHDRTFYNVASLSVAGTQNYDKTMTGGAVVSSYDNPSAFTGKTGGVGFSTSPTWYPIAGGTDGLTLYHFGNFVISSYTQWSNPLPSSPEVRTLDIDINIIRNGSNNFRLTVTSSAGVFTQNWNNVIGSFSFSCAVSGDYTVRLQNNMGGSTALKNSWRVGISQLSLAFPSVGASYDFVIPEKRTGRWAVGESVGGATITAVGVPVLGGQHETAVVDYWQNRIDELRERLMVDLTTYLEQLNTSIALIESHTERQADAQERIATALETAEGEGTLTDIADAVLFLAPLLAA